MLECPKKRRPDWKFWSKHIIQFTAGVGLEIAPPQRSKWVFCFAFIRLPALQPNWASGSCQAILVYVSFLMEKYDMRILH